jgi:hypothetical protein
MVVEERRHTIEFRRAADERRTGDRPDHGQFYEPISAR